MDYVLDLFRASNHDLGHASLRLIEKMKSTYFHSRLASDLAQLTQHRLDYLGGLPSGEKEANILEWEYHVWDLLDRSHEPSTVYHCAQMKAFIQRLRKTLPEHTARQQAWMDEVDQEVLGLWTKKTTAATTKKQTTESHNESAQKLYYHLRNGEFDDAARIAECDAIWPILVLQYIETQSKLLDNERIPWNHDQRTVWRNAYKAFLEDRRDMCKYERAIHGILFGYKSLLEPVYSSWEDVIWAYYNQRIEEALDNVDPSACILDEDILEQASCYDGAVSDPVVHFFHRVIGYLLLNDHQRLVKYVYGRLSNAENFAKSFDAEQQGQLLRFAAILVSYLEAQSNESRFEESQALLNLYTARRSSIQPKTGPSNRITID